MLYSAGSETSLRRWQLKKLGTNVIFRATHRRELTIYSLKSDEPSCPLALIARRKGDWSVNTYQVYELNPHSQRATADVSPLAIGLHSHELDIYGGVIRMFSAPGALNASTLVCTVFTLVCKEIILPEFRPAFPVRNSDSER